MQKTLIVRGSLSKDYGTTVADAINSVLKKNPEFKLVNAIALEADSIRCTLLCVFESAR